MKCIIKMSKMGLLGMALILLSACQLGEPVHVLRLNPEDAHLRTLQTRLFDTKDEKQILAASAGVLQDLGYILKGTETKLGFLAGKKMRETDNKGEQAMANTLMVLNALNGGGYDPSIRNGIDSEQKIRVSLVTSPRPEQGKTAVRVTFQRMVWDMNGNLHRLETLTDRSLYEDFFIKLSKSIFLEAHQI